ncbi:hypothetical protein SRA_03931 [Streptococcus ratti FA-1 = DSM 20564]|uniref:Preprotein translocase subunit SecG n=1 Tax=Streptococcus ratti FA-1 = DSM 20564 TaxID=699248 RepID=A0ABN0GU23_STRRT|nr:hypothetical protein SRA_03931 [Streptococcus ratti FA-1 = DSM 20564]
MSALFTNQASAQTAVLMQVLALIVITVIGIGFWSEKKAALGGFTATGTIKIKVEVR